MKKEKILQAYEYAKEQYAEIGIDTDSAIENLDKINISLHCWQTDDVVGFETPDAVLGGGVIQTTGNYPGKARTIDQLKADIEKVMSLLPGKQRLLQFIKELRLGQQKEVELSEITEVENIEWY